jgi:hypothetical protein
MALVDLGVGHDLPPGRDARNHGRKLVRADGLREEITLREITPEVSQDAYLVDGFDAFRYRALAQKVRD